jgi:hypothetical protein
MKYKSLMRLIEVCIPRFDEETSGTSSVQTRPPAEGFQLSSGLFWQPEMEYNVDDDDDDTGDGDAGSMSREELFFEAEDGSSEVRPQTGAWMGCNLFYSALNCDNTFSSSIFTLIVYERQYRKSLPKMPKNLWEIYLSSDLHWGLR